MYTTKTVEQLKQIEQAARAAIAQGGSQTVMKARYGVLGAVSAELAKR